MRLPQMVSLAVLCCAAADAQFGSLAVSDDGSEVYFRTSLRLKNDSPDLYRDAYAIHRLANGTVERRTTPTGPLGLPTVTDDNPQISRDGSVFAYTHYQYCYGGSGCISRPTISVSYLTIRGQPAGEFPGEAQISRNGRFVLNALVFGFTFPPQPNVIALRDLQSGVKVNVPVRPASRSQALSGAGQILGFTPDAALTLWSPQSVRTLPIQGYVASAIMNDAVTWIVYQRSYEGELRAFEIASGRDVALTGADHPGRTPSISDDGQTVLYVAAPAPDTARQLWLVRPDGSGRRQLTAFTEGIFDAVLSGNGRVAVASTGGRVVAIDTATGAVRELIGRTPVCRPEFIALTPGSILPIRGNEMAQRTEVATVPLPDRLAGKSVTLDAVPVPLLSVSPTEIWFQVPFDLPVGKTAMLEVEHSSFFNGCEAQPRTVVERSPHFFGAATLTIAHQDFSGLVTAQSPAKPGEVVTAWAVGLGKVTPEMPAGVPTPAGRIFPLANPFECHVGYQADGPPVEVLFAGLAPGMIGVYQVSFRIPGPTPPGGAFFLNCGTPGSEEQRHGGIVPVAPATLY